MPVPYGTDGMLAFVATCSADTPPAELVTVAKNLAKVVRDQRDALLAHRGVIVAVAQQDGDDMVQRLEEAWPL